MDTGCLRAGRTLELVESSLKGRWDSGVSDRGLPLGDWRVSSSAMMGVDGALPLPQPRTAPKMPPVGVLGGFSACCEVGSASASRGMMEAFRFGLFGSTGSDMMDRMEEKTWEDGDGFGSE